MDYVIIPDGGATSAYGFVAGVAQAAIKKPGRYDIALLYSTVPAVGAGVFTTNVFRAAPVQISEQHLSGGRMRGVVVNSGCANACTGEQGRRDALEMAAIAAGVLGCDVTEILVASTGVIGVHLPMAKGSGMIHPNMATLLSFITTDASISAACLQAALKEAVAKSFNMVTVDGDSSTNDSLIVLANGQAGNSIITESNTPEYRLFTEALGFVCIELAKMIARDGEGASKLMEVKVLNAPSEEDARLGAKAIAGSNLVKAALFGEDANWGRVVCALGYSGAKFNPDLVDVYLGDLLVAKNGSGLAFDEEKAAQILKEKTIVIIVDMKQGPAEATAWGCDLTYEYVRINGDYRT